jgi:hypothetical protein
MFCISYFYVFNVCYSTPSTVAGSSGKSLKSSKKFSILKKQDSIKSENKKGTKVFLDLGLISGTVSQNIRNRGLNFESKQQNLMYFAAILRQANTGKTTTKRTVCPTGHFDLLPSIVFFCFNPILIYVLSWLGNMKNNWEKWDLIYSI